MSRLDRKSQDDDAGKDGAVFVRLVRVAVCGTTMVARRSFGGDFVVGRVRL